jgi:hypothetical protein
VPKMQPPENRYWSLVEPDWMRLNRSWDESGEPFIRQFRAIPPVVGHLYSAHWCQSEVHNGGLHQFFHNSTGLLAPEALEGFRAIGLTECSNILTEAMTFFGSPYARERCRRHDLLASRRGRRREEWDPFHGLDKRFYEGSNRWTQAADNYADQINPVVLGEAIGIQTAAGPFTVLLRRGTVLPALYSSVYSTGEDNQPAVQISLVAGEPSAIGPPRRLGELVVPDLPLAKKGVLQVPLEVTVDEQGAVSLWVRHPRTGEVSSTTTSVLAVKWRAAENRQL